MATTVPNRSVLLDEQGQRHARELVEEIGGEFSSIAVADSNQRQVVVPKDLAEVIQAVVSAVADGARISIDRLPEELTTTVAADQLGVSRPALMKMIQRGELAARKVGSHHRVQTSDVFELKRLRRERQRRALDELRALDEALGDY